MECNRKQRKEDLALAIDEDRAGNGGKLARKETHIPIAVRNAIREYCSPENILTQCQMAAKYSISYTNFCCQLEKHRNEETLRQLFGLKECFVRLKRSDARCGSSSRYWAENRAARTSTPHRRESPEISRLVDLFSNVIDYDLIAGDEMLDIHELNNGDHRDEIMKIILSEEPWNQQSVCFDTSISVDSDAYATPDISAEATSEAIEYVTANEAEYLAGESPQVTQSEPESYQEALERSLLASPGKTKPKSLSTSKSELKRRSKATDCGVGDLVFAKLKGFKPWPAKVLSEYKTGGYFVYFFGSMDCSNVKRMHVWPYEEHKDDFISGTTLKDPEFYTAVMDATEYARISLNYDLNAKSDESFAVIK